MEIRIQTALIIVSFGFSYSMAQETVQTATSADSIGHHVELQDVVVRGNSVIRKSDRQLYMPSQTQIAQSATGVDLLSKLKIPTLVINPLENTVTLASRGKLEVRINGRPINSNELKAINPKYVKRVEYHDNPSLRFGDAEAVVDFIVKQPTSGGDLMLAAQQSVNRGWGEYNANGKINYKKSEFSFNQYVGLRWNLGQWRDNTEYYKFADNVTKYQKEEKGVPATFNYNTSWSQVGYNFTDPGKQLFSAQLKMWYQDNIHFDFKGTTQNSATGNTYDFKDLSNGYYCTPTLDLYYQRNIKKNQVLFFNLVGSLTPSASNRQYTETSANEAVPNVEIMTSLKGRSQAVIAEADYEITWQKSRLTVGAKHTQNWSKSTYPLLDTNSRMRQAESYTFGEYWMRLGNKFDFTTGIGVSRHYNNELGMCKSTAWVFRPKVNLRYRMSNTSSLKFNFNRYGSAPTLDQLTDVSQKVDDSQISVGNATLKTYTCNDFKLHYEYTRERYYFGIAGKYQYFNSPVMEEKYWKDNNIVCTYDNQRNAQIVGASFTSRVVPIKDWLSLSVNCDFSRYIMHGNTYTHCYNNVYFNGNFELTHWNFTLFGQIKTNQNSLWGETVTGGENFHVLSLSYQCKRNFRFSISAMNPFTNNYSRKSENRNEYAGYVRAAHFSAAERMIVLGVSWNVEWGRKHQSQEKRLNNKANNKANDNAVKAAGKG